MKKIDVEQKPDGNFDSLKRFNETGGKKSSFSRTLLSAFVPTVFSFFVHVNDVINLKI